MPQINDKRARTATPLEIAEEVASYARQNAMIDEACKLASQRGWIVHREIPGSPLPTLILINPDRARLLFIEVVPAEVDGDWRTWLEAHAALEKVAEKSAMSVEMLVVNPSQWSDITTALA